ncbi:MAG: class I SAM-dependent methyltransferase [Syntrophomonadaceae bacterium]|nr:class I SAM-dependent methyltransferase [Syntrophomonadaceae bacterium]
MSKGTVVGIDPSTKIIEESKKRYRNEIVFEVNTAENIGYENTFDVIFCNSAFQWIKNQEIAIEKFPISLKNKGRIGIQTPAKEIYCPNLWKR